MLSRPQSGPQALSVFRLLSFVCGGVLDPVQEIPGDALEVQNMPLHIVEAERDQILEMEFVHIEVRTIEDDAGL